MISVSQFESSLGAVNGGNIHRFHRFHPIHPIHSLKVLQQQQLASSCSSLKVSGTFSCRGRKWERNTLITPLGKEILNKTPGFLGQLASGMHHSSHSWASRDFHQPNTLNRIIYHFARRKGFETHEPFWCEDQREILRGSSRNGSKSSLRTRQLLTKKYHQGTRRCSIRRNEISGFSGTTSIVDWIVRHDVKASERNHVTSANSESGNFISEEDGLPTKVEIHGRKTRAGRPKPHGPYYNILLQGFNWESWKGSKDGKSWWQVLRGQVTVFRSVGITDVWLPPVSQSVDSQGYLPGELYNLDASKYGSGVELKELIDELHTHGISVIADIVINHRSGALQDKQGHWNVFRGGNRDNRLNWGPWAVVDNDVYDSGGKGHHDTGESYAAAPDVDHTNKRVQDELTDWMNWLKAEIGFDGWRFDFVKGYSPEYTRLYCLRTKPTFAVGELWTSMAYDDGQLARNQNRHRQELCDWIDGTIGESCAFDFTTKGILQKAFEGELCRLQDDQGKPPGLIGWWPEKSVTFLDNHDTGSTQRHWAFSDEKIMQGYAYILTHPGSPCIFYDHLFYHFNHMEEIKKLVELRKRHRINAASTVTIQIAEGDIYVAKIDDRVILKLGCRFDMGALLPPADMWNLTLTGQDYGIWETTAPLPPVPVPAEPPQELDESKIEHTRPKQPIYITSKMSKRTRDRILKESSELVEVLDLTKES